MFTHKPARNGEIIWLGSSLVVLAGFVDAIGYLTLRHIYAANMSGNTVSLAMNLANHNWPQVWVRACPLLAFVPGLIVGDAVVEICKRSHRREVLAPSMLLQASGIALFTILIEWYRPATEHPQFHGWLYAVLIALLAFSMGMQNGTLRQIGALRDVKSYVTGTLLAMANALTLYGFWFIDQLRQSPSWRHYRRIIVYSPRHPALRKAIVAGGIWTLYLGGAILGALSVARFGIHIMFAPVALLWLIAIIDFIWPVRSIR